MTSRLLAILFLTGFASHSYAQCCSGGVPMSGTLGASSSDIGNFEWTTSYDLNVLNQLYTADQALNDQSRKRLTHTALTELSYGITDRFSVTTLLSVVSQIRKIEAPLGGFNTTSTFGLGDPVLLVKYRILKQSNDKPRQWTIGAGPKFPLGFSEQESDLGLVLPMDMQAGSGSWDALFWTSLQKFHFLAKNLTISALATYKLNGTNKKYLDTESYQFGNEFAANLTAGYQFFLGKNMFDVSLGFRYRNQGVDQFNSSIIPNSGGNFLFLSPAIGYNFTPNIALRMLARIPIYQNVEGTQLGVSYRLNAGLFFRFKTKRNQV